MNKKELIEYARNYSSKNFDSIKFNWNGKHGVEFEDSNYDFRMQLCELIKNDFTDCPDQLILDLYIELSKSAKETFGVYNSFHLFANELLKRGSIKYFDIYVKGASQSMDTWMSSGRLNLSKSRIKEISDHIKDKLNNHEYPDEVKRYEYMLQRFDGLLKEL